MISIGIMQGRLTPPRGRGIQFFPFEEWKEEFKKAEDIGLNEIEWIFDYDKFEENPLMGDAGIEALMKVISETGIKVNSICWDYFMRRPFYKFSDYDAVLIENKELMLRTLTACEHVGASLIEIPMVDDSSIKNAYEKEKAISFLKWCCDEAENRGIKIGVESDFAPGEFRQFLLDVSRNNVVANYDTGNSSGLGYDHKEELESLNELLYNVHIKDRLYGNGTVALGTGSADFEKVFETLKKIGYNKSIILQAARNDDGNEIDNISSQVDFVKKYLERYEIV